MTITEQLAEALRLGEKFEAAFVEMWDVGALDPDHSASIEACFAAQAFQDARKTALAAYDAAKGAQQPSAQVSTSIEAVIASEPARIDGYDPQDLRGGLYDVRWSGGTTPEPLGDAWGMDYLPKAARIAAAIAARQPPTGWQPIETAPTGVNGCAWMRLAWGPEDDICTGDGMRCGDKFFAASAFYRMNNQAKRFEFREHEVSPTHWMPLPVGPQVQP